MTVEGTFHGYILYFYNRFLFMLYKVYKSSDFKVLLHRWNGREMGREQRRAVEKESEKGESEWDRKRKGDKIEKKRKERERERQKDRWGRKRKERKWKYIIIERKR